MKEIIPKEAPWKTSALNEQFRKKRNREFSVADRVAALPYDVWNREEAKRETQREPMSFLRVDRAETQLGDSVGSETANLVPLRLERSESAASLEYFLAVASLSH